jgi:gliding motility-associated lipoprotein GldD
MIYKQCEWNDMTQVQNFKKIILIIIAVFFSALSCTEVYTPKPRAYFRIEFPQKEYVKFGGQAPYSFEIPAYSFMAKDSSKMAEPFWFNLTFPDMKAKIHLSYKVINKDLSKYIEDSRTLAYKHTIKADAISEQLFIDKKNKIYGILYEIKGNAASPFQFFATDSAKHFIRGSLYFNVYPNKDSLGPVFDFIKPDIIHLIETFRWEKFD